MILAEMSVAQVLEAIANKEMTTQSIADELGVSERTVQRKIKSLGYKWSQVSNRHEPTEPNYKPENNSLLFIEPFKVEPNKQHQEASKEVSATTQGKAKPKQQAGFLSAYLGDEKEIKKTQRNYYMQEDVLSVIDRVSSTKRSDFVNDCLRQFFKDNGLL